MKRTIDTFGGLDGTVNNAGTLGQCSSYNSRIVNIDKNDWHNIIAMNLTGTMYCMKEQLKLLKRGGSIVNIASYAALVSMPSFGPCSAAKHEMIRLTKTAAKEMGKDNIRVNMVIP